MKNPPDGGMMIALCANDDLLTQNDDFRYAENEGKFPSLDGSEIFIFKTT